MGGSGSTYVYGFADSNFKKGMSKEECVQFVLKSKIKLLSTSNLFYTAFLFSALTLAMSRDASSGGVVRLGVITEQGIERTTVLAGELPKFYEGWFYASVLWK